MNIDINWMNRISADKRGQELNIILDDYDFTLSEKATEEFIKHIRHDYFQKEFDEYDSDYSNHEEKIDELIADISELEDEIKELKSIISKLEVN